MLKTLFEYGKNINLKNEEKKKDMFFEIGREE
jgi:hypothetical protein